MKTLTLTLAIAFSYLVAGAQLCSTCLPNGITFKTQEQIDNFQVNYPGCTEIEGDVFIGPHPGNTDITNLDGLSVLTSIHGSLNIGDCYSWPSGNPYLSNIHGLSNLQNIGGDLNIGKNDTLQSLDGLQQLTYIYGDLFIEGNPSLTNLNGLEGLSRVANILVWFNDSIKNLAGLENLKSIEGSLMIEGNELLEDLTGLESLYSIKGDLIIGCVAGVQVGFHRNPSLISLSGLNNLTSVGGQLYINLNDKLTNLSGLENLVSIGSLRIEGNPVLTDITALTNIVSAIGGIEIFLNPNLASLSGIENINAASNPGIYIGIHDNSSLSQCDVLSVCEYLNINSGNINIYENATGCNSQEEIVEACTFGIDQLDSRTIGLLTVIVYPNPASGIVNFQLGIVDGQSVALKIYDMHGREAATLMDGVLPAGEHKVSFNASELPPGIYFYRILHPGFQVAYSGKLLVTR